ncbi:MAG: DnaB-like helicase C-terminal domain-containing protein [Deltaproteobacteria bacterium]|nr:DnaB-like helicase C-terminal domain-containing protein [Deltaproteobacteria bacterium]
MRRGYLGEKDFPKIIVAAAKLMEAPIYIDETPRLSIPEIRIRAKSLKLDKKIRLLMIDSLQQLVAPNANDSAVALKLLARELQVPVVITSSISPMADRRGDKRPILADLADVESLEQEADVILFLYRDELYNPDRENRNELDVTVAKNRNGPTGLIRAWYAPELSKISDFPYSEEDYSREEDEQP